MKTVYFLLQGQFGNNLFQYFAAEVLKKIYHYDAVQPTFYINLEFNTVIDDDKFRIITTDYMKGQPPHIDTSKDILLMGFFQRSDILKFEREYLRSLFHTNNHNHISNRIKISSIINHQSTHEHRPTERDVTLHLRCGDFWDHAQCKSQIFHPDNIKAMLATIPYDKLYIVIHTPEQQWERDYYAMYNDMNPIWIQGTLADDFDFLLRSTTLITSASTMCYMAAFLGQATTVHIPYNYFYEGDHNGQRLAEFDDTICTVHYHLKSWLPPM